MVDTLQCHIAAHRGIAPDPQPVDHVGPHCFTKHQTSRRAAPLPGHIDIASIGFGDRSKDRIVGKQVRKPIEEVSDLGVAGVRQLGKPTSSPTNSSFDEAMFGCGDV